jgi:hypothetical protein
MTTQPFGHAAAPEPGPDLSRVELATVDTLSQPYEIVGMVDASMVTLPGVLPTAELLDMLARQAVTIGGDAVIGIRLTQVALPGVSRHRLLGRGIDHHGAAVVSSALGTAVRRCAENVRMPTLRRRHR